jgi:uncharacterized membrane protein YgcG
MKRFFVGLLLAVLAVGTQPHSVLASVNDFAINDFAATYHLSRDADGRSVVKTTEKIIATFPQIDQNHGIERAIPNEYDGHSLRTSIQSVTDASGMPLTYNDEQSTGNLTILRIGDADTYVHGQKTYIITYTQHDVMRFFADTNDDEFYWDVNGTGWAQTMEKVSAKVFIDSSLAQSLTGNTSCYQGGEGANEKCMVTEGAEDSTKVLSFASTRPLAAGHTVTLAVGFAPHSFAGYQQTAAEKLFAVLLTIWLISLAIGSFAALFAIVWMSVVRNRVMKRAHGRGTIIPEYLPPSSSVLVSALVAKRPRAAMTAQLIDLAVRHYIKIYQVKEKQLFKVAEYEIEVVKAIDDLTEEEKRLLKSVFGNKPPHVGARFAMKKLQDDYTIGKSLNKDQELLRHRVRNSYHFYEKATSQAKGFRRTAVMLLILGVVTLSPLLIIAAVVGFIYAYTLWPLTEKGAELRDYLKGLEMYIEVAEVERIKMLQSPEGAEKVGVIDSANPKQLVKLYERVLPYAVLFGVEKEWLKQLGTYYETGSQQPDWYAGSGAFNAVVFASAMGTFSDQSSMYSSASGGSSSGGSSGGGFSGGGGGGGGGGGW